MAETFAHDGHVHLTAREAGTRASAVDLLADMDGAGVGRAVVVTPSTLGWDNSVTLEAVAGAPDRFVGIARVDLRAADALDRLRDVLIRGAVGIRITLFGESDLGWLRNEEMVQVATALADDGALAEFHAEPAQLADVRAFAVSHPDVTVLVDHLGRPAPGSEGGPSHAAFLALADSANVFVKSPALGFFSAQGFPYADIEPFVTTAIDRFGADRVMWSSDWPGCYEFGSYRATLDGMLAVLESRSDDERHAVLTGTFERLFGRS